MEWLFQTLRLSNAPLEAEGIYIGRVANHSAAHSNLLNSILLALGRHSDVLIWKTQNGTFRAMDNPSRIVKTGNPGSSDIFAVVAPSGRFVSIEVKTGSGVQSDAQKCWQASVERRGGIYGVVRSIEDALKLIEKAKL